MSNPKMVNVKFRIDVRGMIGGSFEMPEREYTKLLKKWQTRHTSHEDTEISEDLLALAPFDYFQHLNVGDMEITELGKDNDNG